ncbi:hypothetical protein CALVIDRAFT_123379 [Calocera viscosa TUFC12733]|uniref:Uncharacterized protein n=1 Tax=Calocera viscosa (strain TUFC12733) TaxID=1330018 RepID=A0A167RNQ0_CALVF|nr:hypothetical protein CALVIDRAFT_123379 [Calocera viscosa TUFC12733]
MRGPNKVKKQSSRGIQPRSSTTSLSSSFNSRDGKSPSSTNTGTPSPTEENFGQLLMDDASGPRNVASTGNLGARITRPADISHPSLSPLATISPGMARSSSGAVLHERSLSNGSTRSAAKPRLSVEAPPVTDASGTGTPVFPSSGKRAPAPGTLGLSVRPELGLGMPTFPNPPTLPGQAPWSGYIPPTAYMASAQQQAAYLPGIPGIPHVPSDFTPTTEGVQYLAYPYGMGAYPGAGMQFPHGPNAAGEGSDAQHVLAAKGYGAGQEYGAHGGYDRGAVKPQPLSPAQLAYMSALVDDRGHSR